MRHIEHHLIDLSVHPQELRPRVSSFGEKDVIMEGVPSTPAQRRRSHYIVLTVHGIAEPGNVASTVTASVDFKCIIQEPVYDFA